MTSDDIQNPYCGRKGVWGSVSQSDDQRRENLLNGARSSRTATTRNRVLLKRWGAVFSWAKVKRLNTGGGRNASAELRQRKGQGDVCAFGAAGRRGDGPTAPAPSGAGPAGGDADGRLTLFHIKQNTIGEASPGTHSTQGEKEDATHPCALSGPRTPSSEAPAVGPCPGLPRKGRCATVQIQPPPSKASGKGRGGGL